MCSQNKKELLHVLIQQRLVQLPQVREGPAAAVKSAIEQRRGDDDPKRNHGLGLHTATDHEQTSNPAQQYLVSNIKETLSHPEFRRARDCQASSKTNNGSTEVAFPIRRRHAAAFPALAAVGRSPDHIEGPVPAGRQ